MSLSRGVIHDHRDLQSLHRSNDPFGHCPAPAGSPEVMNNLQLRVTQTEGGSGPITVRFRPYAGQSEQFSFRTERDNINGRLRPLVRYVHPSPLRGLRNPLYNKIFPGQIHHRAWGSTKARSSDHIAQRTNIFLLAPPGQLLVGLVRKLLDILHFSCELKARKIC